MNGAARQVERAPELRPLDIAYGIPQGGDPIPPLERSSVTITPLEAVEAVMARALQHTPCLISFSGGRDSSALLATAARVARREGLPLPIPATLMFPRSEASNEDEWQATVLKHLDLHDWERFEFNDELDAVGPVATEILLRHGLVWPFNAHFHAPIFERAAGGAVVTGFGGDELGNSLVSARAERLLTTRHRISWSDALIVGLAAAPPFLRTAVHRRRSRSDASDLPWLTPEGVRLLSRVHGASEGSIPLGWEAKVRRWIWRSRYFRLCQENFRIIGAYHGVTVFHPFVEGVVLDALGTVGGFRGLGDRTGLMHEVFGGLLPVQLLERSTKGAFTDPLWTPTARQFAKDWSGEGIDRTLVNPDALRRHWAGATRNLVSTTLLQQAWLHDHVAASPPA